MSASGFPSEEAARLYERLRAHRLPDLNLGDDLQYPHYEGYSLLNIPNTLCGWLGVPPIGEAPGLAAELLPRLEQQFRCVLLVLMDGLAYSRLVAWLEQNPSLAVWRSLAERGVFWPLTSVVPSTTAAALTTLWSGRSPRQHAITGYEMWLKEYGIVVNAILHKPMSYQGGSGGLERAGFRPEAFLGLPVLGEHLARHGVKTYVAQHVSIAASGLSKMLLKEAQVKAFYSAGDVWVNLRHLWEEKRAERFYAWVYWSEVDTFGHVYGPEDERAQAEFALFTQAMERYFLRPLSAAARQGTLLVLCADHGQMATPQMSHYDLRHHPHFTRRLHILPCGENRLAYLYIRPGQVDAVRDYVGHTWPGRFTWVESATALRSGLFGPGVRHPALLDRLGDGMLVAHGEAYLWWAQKANELLGRHGGLHPIEMIIPFLAAPLSGGEV